MIKLRVGDVYVRDGVRVRIERLYRGKVWIKVLGGPSTSEDRASNVLVLLLEGGWVLSENSKFNNFYKKL